MTIKNKINILHPQLPIRISYVSGDSTDQSETYAQINQNPKQTYICPARKSNSRNCSRQDKPRSPPNLTDVLDNELMIKSLLKQNVCWTIKLSEERQAN